MSCEVKVIADSVAGPTGQRIVTLQLRYWRAIHSEFMTHRMFSRNASSSRAIPVEKMIEQVRSNPAGPCYWGMNKPGMQAGKELEGLALESAKHDWEEAALSAANQAQRMHDLGLHKQVVNRLLEPFQYISVVVTATEWDNFFELRCHPDAQPEMYELAQAMRAAMGESIPVRRMTAGELSCWHLPYIRDEERHGVEMFSVNPQMAARVSAARCARVSYLRHDGAVPSIEDDLALFELLAGSRPLHASPCEHQARAYNNGERWSGNFRGWFQFRKWVEDICL